MFRIALIAACFLLAVQGYHLDEELLKQPEGGGEIWAVLIAGSSNWYNYRHQSDVCHAYHLLTKKHGIPRRNVITFMVNDIAFNSENPNRGHILNALSGKDVYEGVMIDYMGIDVTPQNFLDVLLGKDMDVGSRKTLLSGPKDKVFVNFVDHGAPGVLGFPMDELHLADLTNVLDAMHSQQKYKQMLWYVEACFSGSMFNTLDPNMNITAHTAANESESSWACIWDDDIGVYLGDCWSLNWMNNTEQFFPNLVEETVEQQYLAVKNMTFESHTEIFGDLTLIYKEPISFFMGHKRKKTETEPLSVPARKYSYQSTATPDVMMYHLERKRGRSNNKEEADRLDQEIKYHTLTEGKVQEILDQISRQVTGSLTVSRYSQTITDPECNKGVLSAFFSQCYKMQTHPYITKYLYRLTNLCNAYNVKKIVDVVIENCDGRKVLS